MTDDIKITMNVNMKGKTQTMKFTKQQYLTMLKQGWAQYQNYSYSKSNLKIQLRGKKAFVSADVRESMTVQGKKISGNSKEKLTIEMINGKPMITNVVGFTTM